MNTSSFPVVHPPVGSRLGFAAGAIGALALSLVVAAFPAQARAESKPAPSAGKMVEPGQALANIQTAIADLTRANQASMFDVKAQEAKEVGDALKGIKEKVATVQKKYQGKTAPVNEREIYKEVEQALSAKELAAIDTMRALHYKQGVSIQQYSPDPSHCANHCEKTCGYDGVGNKVCWFTCYYCCGHGGC